MKKEFLPILLFVKFYARFNIRIFTMLHKSIFLTGYMMSFNEHSIEFTIPRKSCQRKMKHISSIVFRGIFVISKNLI